MTTCIKWPSLFVCGQFIQYIYHDLSYYIYRTPSLNDHPLGLWSVHTVRSPCLFLILSTENICIKWPPISTNSLYKQTLIEHWTFFRPLPMRILVCCALELVEWKLSAIKVIRLWLIQGDGGNWQNNIYEMTTFVKWPPE